MIEFGDRTIGRTNEGLGLFASRIVPKAGNAAVLTGFPGISSDRSRRIEGDDLRSRSRKRLVPRRAPSGAGAKGEQFRRMGNGLPDHGSLPIFNFSPLQPPSPVC